VLVRAVKGGNIRIPFVEITLQMWKNSFSRDGVSSSLAHDDDGVQPTLLQARRKGEGG
jgi:hypothetical protein